MEVRDDKGRQIKVGSRVYVRSRPSLARGEELPGYGGEVEAVSERCVTIREYGTCHTRDARPTDVAVQYGNSRASLDHEAMLQAIKNRGSR